MYYRFMLCGYLEAYVKHLIAIIVYFKMVIIDLDFIQKFYPFTPSPHFVFDVTIYVFLYCVSINKLLEL